MDDGVRLGGTLFLPQVTEPVPALLEAVPYRTDDATYGVDHQTHGWFTTHGYACLRLDVRGSGSSAGIIEDEYTPREQLDTLAVIAWLAAQPWCTGAVGMWGVSWGGFSAIHAAMHAPPPLRAIVPIHATHDRYTHDVHYYAGTLHASEPVDWPALMVAMNALPPDPEHFGPKWRAEWRHRLEHTPQWPFEWLRHQRRDAYWKNGSLADDWTRIRCPVLAIGGWYDGYRDAVLEMMEHLGVPRRAVIGPWGHNRPNRGWPGPPIDHLDLMLRWWDRWLRDVPNGVDTEAAVALYVADAAPRAQFPETIPGHWAFATAWPPPGQSELVLHLRGGGKLAADAAEGDEAPDEWTGPPWTGVAAPFWCGSGPPYGVPGRIDADAARSLLYATAPLDAPVVVCGRVTAEVCVSASEPVALVALRLCDLAPDGTIALLARGALNLTHRDGHANPAPLTPFEPVRAAVRFEAAAATVPAGHSLVVTVAGADWPHTWPPPRPFRLRVFHDAARPSFVRVPRGEALILSGPTFPAPVALPAAAEPVAVPAPVCRTESTADGARHEVLFVEHETIPARAGLGFRYAQRVTLQVERDPASCRAEGEAQCALTYPDGSAIEAVGLVRLTCDADEFHMHVALDVREAGEPVFARTWDDSVPRDLM